LLDPHVNTDVIDPAAASSITTNLHTEAAKIPDGDEMSSPILPLQTMLPIAADAGWACDLAGNPGSFLNALEGDRPDGDIMAMLALLRQTQGPLSDNEDNNLFKQYAPYVAINNTRTRSSIRKQNELLVRTLIHQQMMARTAWEYDFALTNAEFARRMGDTESLEVAELLAQIQREIIEQQKQSMTGIATESKNIPPIPSAETLLAEAKTQRQNAITALELGPATPNGKRTLLGHLEYENAFFEKATENAFGQIDIQQKGQSVTFREPTQTVPMGLHPDTGEPWEDTKARRYRCSWEFQKRIAVYGDASKLGTGEMDPCPVPFKVSLEDAGTKLLSNTKGIYLIVGVGISTDEKGGPIPAGINVNRRYSFPKHLAKRVGNPDDSLPPPAGQIEYIEDVVHEVSLYPSTDDGYVYLMIQDESSALGEYWTVYLRYRWMRANPNHAEAAPFTATAETDDLKEAAIAEHQANIAAAERVMKPLMDELATEKDPKRQDALRVQILHLRQNIHDSKDLIASIRSGETVKTRGPWDENNAVLLARASVELRQDCLRAQQMQATYVRLMANLARMKPSEANVYRQQMSESMIKDIFKPGGFERAGKALERLRKSTLRAAGEALDVQYLNQAIAFADMHEIEWRTKYVENVKYSADQAVFYGSFFTGMGPGMALAMSYEAAGTALIESPEQAIKNAAIQGVVMATFFGVLKVGAWGVDKFFNPKVARSEINTLRNMLRNGRYDHEMASNKALVDNLKRRVTAFEKCKLNGGKDYLKIRAQLDDAVAAVNSSSLAKRQMKNELMLLQNEIKSGATSDLSKLRDCIGYQEVFNRRLHKSIYPRVDLGMVKRLRQQGYNVEAKWFREFRNASSVGVNADRDLGLIAKLERNLMKNGQPVSLQEFMRDGQKAYDAAYRDVTGRSSLLADQMLTTSASDEAFPLSWLQQKFDGPFSTLDPPHNPADFEKASKAIYNKVQNALSGPDPAFVNLKKACASLSKDLKTKVFPRLTSPPPGTSVPATSRQAALAHWKQVEQIMSDFALDKADPLTTARRLQRVTGSPSITQSADEVRRLLNRLGTTN
jgi:hypothetical protein